MDTLPTAEGEPDVLLHHKETDIEPAVQNLVGKKLCEGEGETNDTVGNLLLLPPVYSFPSSPLQPGVVCKWLM